MAGGLPACAGTELTAVASPPGASACRWQNPRGRGAGALVAGGTASLTRYRAQGQARACPRDVTPTGVTRWDGNGGGGVWLRRAPAPRNLPPLTSHQSNSARPARHPRSLPFLPGERSSWSLANPCPVGSSPSSCEVPSWSPSPWGLLSRPSGPAPPRAVPSRPDGYCWVPVSLVLRDPEVPGSREGSDSRSPWLSRSQRWRNA